MPQQHLPEVHHPEERADADRVERVLAVGRDPLRVEVLLRQVAGERLDDRGEERHHAGDPRPGPTAAPGGHEELAPQVDDHERHEQLNRPQVHAVEEVTGDGGVPPVRPAQRDQHSGADRDDERGKRSHPEHVHPTGDVGRLGLRQQPAGRQPTQPDPTQATSPRPCRRFVDGLARPRLLLRGLDRRPAASLERQQQRGDEHNQHADDDQQVRQRDGQDSPVQVLPRRVQVHEGRP